MVKLIDLLMLWLSYYLMNGIKLLVCGVLCGVLVN
jgi:hypothetical protein